MQTLLNQTNASTDLDEEVKKRIVASYEQALQALQSADEATAQLNTFTELESSPSRQLESVLAQIEALKQPAALPKTSSSSELEQLIQVKVEQLDQDKKRLETLTAEPRRRADRRAEIPQIIVAARYELDQVIQQLQTASDTAAKDTLADAQRIQLLARKQELHILLPSLEKELAAYLATAKLLSAQTELASQTVSRLEAEISQLREELARQQHFAAEKKIREAQRMKASEANFVVKQMLDHYAQLAEEAKQVNEKLTDRQRQLDNLTKTVDGWNRRIARTENRVKAGGTTPAIGLLLRRELAELPHRTGPFTRPSDLVAEIRTAQLRYFELLDRQADLNDQSFIAKL